MSITFPMPPNETERIATLRRYEILDTGPEEAFDRVTHLAASLFATPIAFVSFIDSDRQWFKSRIGISTTETPRAVALCAHTIVGTGVCTAPDTLKDARFNNYPIVKGGPRIRFYAGVPLTSRDGHCLGTLCVMDTVPRSEFASENTNRLETLGRLIMNELDRRLELAARIRAERDLKLVNSLLLAFAEAPNVNSAIEMALGLICDAVGAVHGRAWTVDGSATQCQLVAAWGPTGTEWNKRLNQQRSSPLTLDNSAVGIVLTQNRRLVLPDLTTMEIRFQATRDAVAIGLRSAVIVPVRQDGRNFALNFMFDRLPNAIDLLADRIEELAKKIRPALSRKLAEERISLLQSVVLHADDAVMVAEIDGDDAHAASARIVYASPALTRMTGYSLEELHGRSPETLWAAKSGEETAALLYRPIRDGEPSRLEVACTRRDGSEYWADISAVPLCDDVTGHRKLIAILRDTTERRRLEEALRESESTFRLLFANNPIPMWVHDLETLRFLEVNNSAVEQYGYRRERFLAMTSEDILWPAVPTQRPSANMEGAPSFGRPGVRRHRKADGAEISVELVSHRFEFQGRQAAIVAAIDVTEQRRAEEEIRRAKEDAEAASQAKSELLANMSHELRTPLNAIIGFSEIMQAGLFGPLGSPRYEGYIADIRHSAGHLLTVINDILDLAKIEANSFRLHEGVISPADIIASALRLVKPRADMAGVGMNYDKRHSEIVVRVDETALKRVLINLLSNAVKFSEAGTTVFIVSELDRQGALAISVVDKGIGMAPEEIPIALTPFRQVNSGLQRKYEGTGLGLPIAKQLVELHGGTLTIESAPRAGTTVMFTLPNARVMAAA